MATITFEIEDHILRKAKARILEERINLQMLLRNRIVELAYATPLWHFEEEPYDEEQIKQLGHISLRAMMYR